jgi:hypothetical protein
MGFSGQCADPDACGQNDNCRQIGGSCVELETDELEPPACGGPPAKASGGDCGTGHDASLSAEGGFANEADAAAFG